MVWIFFLSTNRNIFQRNQLRASTLGPEMQRNSIYLFQIESSGTFLTSHISAMLYHIVSEASKFGQFRWSGFFSYQQTGFFFNGINYGHPPPDRNSIDTPSISLKSNLMELFSQATFPQCYNTQCQKRKNQVSSDGPEFFPINKPEHFSPESTTGIHPRTGAAEELHLSFPNRFFWNFSHKLHFRNAIPHSVRIFEIRSIPMVWIFFLSTNRNFFQRNQLRASTLGPELQTNSIYSFQIESYGTFLTSHISTKLYHIVSEASKFGQFRWSGFVYYQQTGTFLNGINYGHPPSDRSCRGTPSIFSKSNLMELFSQATFPQCYTTQCQKLQNSVNSNGLDLFTINKPELFSTESTTGIHPRAGTAEKLYSSLPNRIFWIFSHKLHFRNAIPHSVRSFKIRSIPMVWIFFPINKLELFQTESTRGVHPRTETAEKLHLSLPNRIFSSFSHKPHFRNAIPHSVRSFKIRSIPMVWICLLSTKRNFFQRNQLRASTLEPELQRNSIYLFQIESSGTFLTSHISAMLYHIVSEASKFGQFRWSGFFSYVQTGTFFNRINQRHPSSNRNFEETLSISSKSNLLELFSQATFPQCYTTQCQKLQNSVNSDGLDFFPMCKPELFSTESTRGIHPRTETLKKLYLSLPNRIFWNFSHKPHFRNAIPHSVRIFKIRSIPMVWIFFLSTNWNFFQRNQLRASTLGPKLQKNCIYLFQIESSGTFLTSHISAMLYHIVSEASKFGQFRWSGFFSYKQTGIFFNRIHYGHPPPDRNRIDTPFRNRILWNFSHKPHFHNAKTHSVRSVKIRSVPMVWIFFLSTNRNIFQRNQLRASTLGSELQRNFIYLFQIDSSGTFLTSHISAML